MCSDTHPEPQEKTLECTRDAAAAPILSTAAEDDAIKEREEVIIAVRIFPKKQM